MLKHLNLPRLCGRAAGCGLDKGLSLTPFILNVIKHEVVVAQEVACPGVQHPYY